MGAAAEKMRMSEADYLDWESRAKDKHEYVAGEIFGMAGASERQNGSPVIFSFTCAWLRAAIPAAPSWPT